MRLSRLLIASLLASCAAPLEVRSDDGATDVPVTGLDAAWTARFLEGDAAFDFVYREADGLGPVAIRQSCTACHEDARRGPGFVERMAQVDASGQPVPGQPALAFGTVVRRLTAGAAHPILPPEGTDILRSVRGGMPVFGRGYLEAVADEELLRLEREQQGRTDGVSGRINRVSWSSAVAADPRFHGLEPGAPAFGRFGLKARQPTLDDFTADALAGDMGLTTPLRPVEVSNPDGLTDDAKPGLDVDLETVLVIADYVRTLAIPRRAEAEPRAVALFAQVGCDACHVPELATRAQWPIAPLAGIQAPVFTDLLVHDMGPGFSDGLTDGEAGPSEWRTAPLIGLRFLRSWLHDGRAPSVEQAIVLHGGQGSEARTSVEAWQALPESDRALLLTYVSSL